MTQVSVQDAIGKRLAHDLSRFVDGDNERTPFRRGHLVTKEDVPHLLSMGREHLFVLENEHEHENNGKVHEETAARRLAALCRNTGIVEGTIREGKIELFADCEGLFRIDVARQRRINSIDGIMIVTRNSLFPVHSGDKLAAVKVVPLEIEGALLQEAEALAEQGPILEILPYKLKTAGLVITGSEIKGGRIQDAFEPLLAERLKALGIQLTKISITGDGLQNILSGIAEIRAAKPDLVLCTGGMSVDPDDNTPGAIIQSGAKLISYGAPVLPGSMMMLAYYDDGVPIMGVPGGALYKKDRGGILDLILPRLAAGIRMTKDDFVAMGSGGLCLGCAECHYPVCPYGKV